MSVKKVIEFIVGISVVTLGVLVFDFSLYLFEMLHAASKPIYQEILKNGLTGFDVKHWIIIFFALMWAIFFVFIIQFFKSLYDRSIKIFCDMAAEKLVNKLEKWTGK